MTENTARKTAPKAKTAAKTTEPVDFVEGELAPVAPRKELTLHEKCAAHLREEGVTPVIVTFQGDKFVFPKSIDDVSGTALDFLAMDRVVNALPLLLDPARPDEGDEHSELGRLQWMLFKSKKPRRPEYVQLFQLWNKSGLTSGE